MEQWRHSFAKFLAHHLDTYTDSELAKMMRAMHMVVTYHGEQLRRTGEPYWEHCLAVAAEIRDARYGIDGIIAALLHDIVEDCDSSLVDKVKEDITKHFGEKVLAIVLCLTKSEKDTYMSQLEEGAREYHEVPAIKLADRGHNLSTVTMLQDDYAWQLRYINETRDDLIPLFERCSMVVPEKFDPWYSSKLRELHYNSFKALYLINLHHRPSREGSAST